MSKLPFLTTWPRKRAPQKHYKNRGFSKAFLEKKQLCVTKWPFLDKKPKSRNSSYHFFGSFLLFQQQKHKHLLKPLFYSVLANLQKREFSKNELKTEKFEKPNFCTLFLKRLFLENWQIIGHKKKHKNDNCVRQKIA